MSSAADCQAVPGDWEALRPYLLMLVLRMDLDRGVTVWEGTVPGEPGERWKGRRSLGTARDLLGQMLA